MLLNSITELRSLPRFLRFRKNYTNLEVLVNVSGANRIILSQGCYDLFDHFSSSLFQYSVTGLA